MRIFLTTLLFAVFAVPLLAQDFDKGWDAYTSGDYTKALKHWRPLAEQGSFRAQHNIGFMYRRGIGVAQNGKEAIKWFSLAAHQDYTQAQINLGLILVWWPITELRK